ncbi:TetR/AcrR family transcriptional regulator [Sphingomonas adhaesiva]|uniref:TetR/AcrR family transcriptional regulator n=1 Tax=Sphingomonas adhaesiva TaxID=28212 RepID=UPI0020D1F87A|nr:TetR/AcrR family transcriptional regulator [Sphingomonas adhaesiva]
MRSAEDLEPFEVRSTALRAESQTRIVLERMRQEGLISIGSAQLDFLATNIWIVSAYWIDYLVNRGGVTEFTREQLSWGARQISSLFEPYLTEAGAPVIWPSASDAAEKDAG